MAHSLLLSIFIVTSPHRGEQTETISMEVEMLDKKAETGRAIR
jgi:hypothetical protein